MALTDIGTEVLACIRRLLGVDPVACFAYGSYARGARGLESDLDCLVITVKSLELTQVQMLRASFIELQLSLGFCPDVQYPVEAFSLDECHKLLDSASVLEYIHRAWQDGQCSRRPPEDDGLELLGALVSTKVVFCGSQIIRELEEYAWMLLGSNSQGQRTHAEILALFGVELGCCTSTTS